MILFKRLFVTGFIFSVLQLSTATACNVTATISTNNATTICEGKSVQVRVDIANGTGPYNLVISDTSGAEIFTESNFGGTLVYFSFNQSNTYFVSEIYDLGADCAGTGIDSIVVSVNPAPAATLSGGGSICDDGVSEACLDIELTSGEAPFTFRLIGSESGNLSYNSTNKDYQVCTMNDQDFVWLDLTDNNGCKAESEDLTGNAEVNYFEEPNIFSPIYYCPNGHNAPYEYVVTIEVTPGTGTPTLTSADATFTNTTGNTWVSSAIDQSITTTLQLDDENNCSPITLTGLNFPCSCPTSATLTATTLTEICDDGSSSTTLELTTQGGTGPYDFTLSGPNGTTVVSETNFSAFPYSLAVSESGTYQISNFYDNGEACEALKNGTIDIIVYDLPTAQITYTGPDTICPDENPEICFEFTGTAPFAWDFGSDQFPLVSFQSSQSPYCWPSNTDIGTHTYSLYGISDANCPVFPSNESVSYTVKDCIIGLAESKPNNPLTIYPNPIEANQAIGIDHEGIGTLSVYSVDGSLILESEYNGSETRVNAPEQSGLFLIKFVDQNGQVFTAPLVIE